MVMSRCGSAPPENFCALVALFTDKYCLICQRTWLRKKSGEEDSFPVPNTVFWKRQLKITATSCVMHLELFRCKALTLNCPALFWVLVLSEGKVNLIWFHMLNIILIKKPQHYNSSNIMCTHKRSFIQATWVFIGKGGNCFFHVFFTDFRHTLLDLQSLVR